MRESPFVAVYDPFFKKQMLTWIGVKEKCDVCRLEFPMILISIVGKQFVCKDCRSRPVKKESIYDFLEDCECCFFPYPLEDLIIHGNKFFCPECYKKIYEDADKCGE